MPFDTGFLTRRALLELGGRGDYPTRCGKLHYLPVFQKILQRTIAELENAFVDPHGGTPKEMASKCLLIWSVAARLPYLEIIIKALSAQHKTLVPSRILRPMATRLEISCATIDFSREVSIQTLWFFSVFSNTMRVNRRKTILYDYH